MITLVIIIVITLQIIITLIPLLSIRKDKTFIKKNKGFLMLYITAVIAVIVIEIILISL